MQSLMQELPQRVFGIFKEQTVVAKRRHGNGDLSKVVEILQHRTLQKNNQTQAIGARERKGAGRDGGMGEASSVEARGLGSVCKVQSQDAQYLLRLRPTSTFTSFRYHIPISPWDCPPAQCWKCSLLAPKGRHSSGQEGQLQSPGLTPTNILGSPPPGADPSGSVQEIPHFCFVALTTNIQVETVNTPAPHRWVGQTWPA